MKLEDIKINDYEFIPWSQPTWDQVFGRGKDIPSSFGPLSASVKSEFIETKKIGRYNSLEIPSGATHIEIEDIDYDQYDSDSVDSLDIKFTKKTLIKNENYEEELRIYNLYRLAYKLELEKHKSKQIEQEKEKQKKLYLELKKIYDN